jgi:hypothetical protein
VSQCDEKCCPAAVFVGAALLDRYQFRINLLGIATLVANDKAAGLGRGLAADRAGRGSAEHVEGVDDQFYHRRFVNPCLGSRFPRCLIYVADEIQTGRPRIGCLEQVLVGAKPGLPGGYSGEIAAWVDLGAAMTDGIGQPVFLPIGGPAMRRCLPCSPW